MYFACYLYVCVCVCVAVYVCMLRVLCNAVSWRRAPHKGQACLFPPSALFANMNPAPRGARTRVKIKTRHTPSKSGPVVTLSMLFSRSHWSASQQALPKTQCVPLQLSHTLSTKVYIFWEPGRWKWQNRKLKEHLPWGRSQKMRFVLGGFSCTNSPTSCTWRKIVDGYKRNIVSLPKHHIRISRAFATLMWLLIRWPINRSNRFSDFVRLDRLDRFGKIIKSIFSKFWKREFQFFFGFPEFLRIFEVSGKIFFWYIFQIFWKIVLCRCSLLDNGVGCGVEGTWFVTDCTLRKVSCIWNPIYIISRSFFRFTRTCTTYITFFDVKCEHSNLQGPFCEVLSHTTSLCLMIFVTGSH